jgi:hypothetical protein
MLVRLDRIGSRSLGGVGRPDVEHAGRASDVAEVDLKGFTPLVEHAMRVQRIRQRAGWTHPALLLRKHVMRGRDGVFVRMPHEILRLEFVGAGQDDVARRVWRFEIEGRRQIPDDGAAPRCDVGFDQIGMMALESCLEKTNHRGVIEDLRAHPSAAASTATRSASARECRGHTVLTGDPNRRERSRW